MRLYVLTAQLQASLRAEDLDVRLLTGPLGQSATWRALADDLADSLDAAVCVYAKPSGLVLGQHALCRMQSVLTDTGASMVYADLYQVKAGQCRPHKLIDHGLGSVRDDFDFGSLWCFPVPALRAAAEALDDCRFAAWYQLRLRLSENGPLWHLPELL